MTTKGKNCTVGFRESSLLWPELEGEKTEAGRTGPKRDSGGNRDSSGEIDKER